MANVKLQTPTLQEPALAGFDRLALGVLQSLSAAVAIVDLQADDQPLVFVNEAFCRLTGYAANEVLGRNCRFLQHPQADPAAVGQLRRAIDKRQPASAVVRNRRRDGSDFWNALQLVPLAREDGLITHYIGYQQELSEWSMTAHAVLSMDEQGQGAAWDRFEQVVADALAEQTATPMPKVMIVLRSSAAGADPPGPLSLPQRVSISVCLRPLLVSGAVLHFPKTGGLALLAPLRSGHTPGTLAEHVQSRLRAVWPCVAGIADLKVDGGDPRRLLAVAEAASLRARDANTDSVCFADTVRDAHDRRQRLLLRDLPGALAASQLRLVFQPIVELASGKLSGFEALLRWRHPTLGEVMPLEFIAQLESRPEIREVTRWIVQDALSHLARWDAMLDVPLRVSINLPAEALLDDDFVACTLAQVARHELSPRQLEFELSERSLAQVEGPAVARLHELRSHGVLVAIDDFGMGWSSLAYLARLPVDTLKVDLRFSRGVTNSRTDAAIARMTVELARGLGLRCVAEGIEQAGQRRFFGDLGCHEGQGFLFARPLEAPDVDALLLAPVCFPAVEGAGSARTDRAAPMRHLLILDDEENVLRALRRSLRPAGFQIHIADTPEAAFEALALFPIGVVIADQRMPRMTGSEFLHRVKDLYPQTRRIVLSGYTDLKSITDAINQGAIYKFLTKPWNDVELLAQLETAFVEYEVGAENGRLHSELQAANRHLSEAFVAQGRRMNHGETALGVMHAAIAAVAVPVIGLDPGGDMVMINAAAERLFAPELPMLGEPVAQWLGVDFSAMADRPAHRVLIRQRHYTVHCRPMKTGERTLGLVLTLLENPT